MQYPVIDLIISAYINNGWTGLDISTGKNKLNPYNLLPISLTGVSFLSIPVNRDIIEYGLINPITFKLLGSLGETKKQFALYLYDTVNNREMYIGTTQNLTVDNDFTLYGQIRISNIDFSKPLTIRIYAQPYAGSQSSTITGVMLAEGYEEDFIPFTQTTDIFSRLKLPLPHYFPHSVIDALQRAAAGTQTADDTEVLRHYLTPLGIGGI